MKSRCDNPKAWNYDGYGKRGITHCKYWDTFEGFWNNMKDSYSPDKTLHRLDNDEDYNPENCCWASVMEQNNLKGNSVLITHDGQTLNATQWAEKLNVSRHTIYARKKRGWSDDKILTTPVRDRTSPNSDS